MKHAINTNETTGDWLAVSNSCFTMSKGHSKEIHVCCNERPVHVG